MSDGGTGSGGMDDGGMDSGGIGGRSSRNRRERVASPLGLGLTGIAFAVSFALLAPSRDAFRVDSDTVATGDAVAVDDLRLAYLKARGAAGELGPEEALGAVTVLARDGRVDAARTLLDASPALVLDEADRLTLDIELAAGEVRRAGDGARGDRDRATLAALLQRQYERAGTPAASTLARGATLARQARVPRLAAAFSRELADVEPARAATHYAECARLLVGVAPARDAIDCYLQARTASDDPAERFALGLELLPLLPNVDPADRRGALVDELLAHRPVSPRELDSLATALLAIERPDAAAGVYARLADADPASRGRALEAAARWSEAAGRPAEAAVFLDRMTPDEIGAAGADAHARRIEALLVGAGRAQEALDRIALRVAAAPDDADTVREAVQLAAGQGEIARALAWNAALLVARPDDGEALARQTTLALAVGRPGVAREAAARAHALAPDDVETLERLAELAEWDGDPGAALRHRRELARLRGDDDDLAEVVRVAEILRHPGIAAEALTSLAERAPLPDDDLSRLMRLHELDGRPDEAVRVLELMMTRYGTREWILRELAALHTRHFRQREALDVWQRLAARYGRSTEETLARVELHWRLGEEDRAAELAGSLEKPGFGSTITPWQASLLAEIGWRYRLPAVAAVARPLLVSVENEDQRVLHGRRSIDDLIARGDKAEALVQAESLWRADGDPDFALAALGLAIEQDDTAASERLLAATEDVEALRAMPAYWSMRATAALRRGDPAGARRAYRTALGIDAGNHEATAGLLWLHIGEEDHAAIRTLMAAERERAANVPDLWGAFAVGHVTIGDPEGSLPWFERALDTPRGDYGLLLTFADALEAAGRVDHARRVRSFAVARLRPELLDGVAGDRETLLQQYGRVLARHGGVEANEAWLRYVLNTGTERAGNALLWREDMAISWLMATERHEHARLVMARLHERRLAAPAWQDLALALRADDTASVEAMLASGTGLSAGNRMLALRHVGRDADAWALAVRTLDDPATPDDLAIAESQYASLRRFRPNHASGFAGNATGGGVAIAEAGFSIRHTLGMNGIGLGLDLARERLVVDGLDADGPGDRSRVALSLFRESARQGYSLTAGFVDDGDDDHVWGAARYARRTRDGRQELGLEAAWREYGADVPVLRLATVQSRAGVTLESALGASGFARLAGEVNELTTRVTDRRVARGVASRAELGLRGAAGDVRWSSSIAAATADNDRAEVAPAGLGLPPGTTLDEVLAARSRTLSLNGSLARGSVGEAWPDGGEPRWFVNGAVAQALPDGALSLRLDAGAGIRVLGNDELGFGVARDARLAGTRAEPDATRIGFSYRRHF